MREIGKFLARDPSPSFRVVVFLLSVTVLAVGLMSHSMWRDEMQAWLIVRDSHGLGELLHNLRYEGHPALWYLALDLFRVFGRQPEWLKVAQGACASGTVALIVWRGPFSRLEMLLLPFTFALLFDYGVKSRNYALGILLLLLFCATYPHRRRHPVVCALILALLVNVHVLFVIIGCACLGTLLFDRLRPSSPRPRFSLQDIPAAGIMLAAMVAAPATAWPPSDSGYAEGWQFDLAPNHVANTFETLSDFLALKVYRFPESAQFSAWLGLLLLVILLVRWRRSPEAAVFFILGTAGLILFFHAKYASYMHGGSLLFVVMIAAIWLSRTTPTHQGSSGLLPRALFGSVIGIQAIHGLGAVAIDAFHRPYSNGHAIARFIDRQGWTGSPIFATSDAASSTVLGYLGVDKFYYAQGERWGSFVLWDKQRLAPVDLAAFWRLAANSDATPILLDCAFSLQGIDPADYGFEAVASFTGSATGEDCTVYRRQS